MDIIKFSKIFNSEEACQRWLEARRWPNGAVCVHCGSVGNAFELGRARYWRCKSCNKGFTVLHGTPMEGTHLPLCTWLYAAYLIAGSSKGISSMKMAGYLGVSYKTAWFLSHRLKEFMADPDFILQGVVEVDEVYLGGKRKKGQTSKRDDDDDQPTGRAGTRKTMAIVAVERDGKAKARKGKTHSERTIAGTVIEWVSRSAVLCTDELPAYRRVGRQYRAHLRVNHSLGEYVRRDPYAVTAAHVNTAESMNATIKRAYIGVYHWFSAKHCDRYLSEISFRWNRRNENTMERLSGLFGMNANRLTWKTLTARA